MYVLRIIAFFHIFELLSCSFLYFNGLLDTKHYDRAEEVAVSSDSNVTGAKFISYNNEPRFLKGTVVVLI